MPNKKKPAIHVTPREKGWAVKKEGNERAYSLHRTKKEAEKQARQTSQKDNTEIIIHNKDGQIARRDTSGGNDPNPPKDKR